MCCAAVVAEELEERDEALLSAGLPGGGRAARGSSKGVDGSAEATKGENGEAEKGEWYSRGELAAANDDEREVDTTLLG